MAYSNGEILIEKNIKLPEYEHRSKYPFANMAVGDSFEIDVYTDNPSVLIHNAVAYWKKVTGNTARFTVRSTLLKKPINDAYYKYYRIRTWRIK